jgi:hypothetical protein
MMNARKDAYEAYINSDVWSDKRRERLKLDSYRCQKCGTAENLHVHHRTYKNFMHESMEDLVTVCISCHDLIHRAYKKSKHESLSEITEKILKQPPVVKSPPSNMSKKRKAKIRKSDGKGARKHVVP